MSKPSEPDVTDELAALYVAGAMPDAEARAFEDRLAAGWPKGEAALQELASVTRALTDVEAVDPPSSVKTRLFAKLDAAPDPRATDRAATRTMSGVTFQFQEDTGFVPTEFPGIAMRMLSVDPTRRQFTCLMRIDPGATYPGHSHDGVEECLVLEGEIIVGDVRLRKGDYQRAEPGSDHVIQRSETGALIFLTAPVSLLHH